MVEKHISLLNEQISKLNSKDFDLEAWKSYTVILLERIFGNKSHKIAQIQNLKYDFGSWSLRDTTGNKTGLEACKDVARRILEASIEELNDFGLPGGQNSAKPGIDTNFIVEILENNLTVSQYREISKILKSAETPVFKKSEIISKLKEYGKDSVENILAGILVHTDVVNTV